MSTLPDPVPEVSPPPQSPLTGQEQWNLPEQERVAIDLPVAPRVMGRLRQFTRHASLFTLSNLASLAANGALAFVLPRILSMESYGYYRLFLLYGGFAGLLHLCFLDGVLIRWAESPAALESELTPAFRFLALEHLLLLPAIGFSALLITGKSTSALIAAILIYVALWNWGCLGQYALQARKLFGSLSLFIVAAPILTLGGALLLHWVWHLTLVNVIACCLVANFIVTIMQWRFVTGRVKPERVRIRILRLGFHDIGLGWSVLGANLIAALAVSLDRFVLSAKFPIRDFAIYSFAANALGLTYNMILSVARVVFPYLAQDVSRSGLSRALEAGEAGVLLLWSAGLAAYFPVAWIVQRWLPAYQQSLPLIQVLMLATGFVAAVQVVHSPFLRLLRKQNQFLVGACAGLLTAGVLLMLAMSSLRLIWFAWAMVGSAAAWWLANELILQHAGVQRVSRTLRQFLLWALSGTVFLLCVSRQSLVVSAGLYTVWLLAFGPWLWSIAARRLGLPTVNLTSLVRYRDAFLG